jgi:hypothetical protein
VDHGFIYGLITLDRISMSTAGYTWCLRNVQPSISSDGPDRYPPPLLPRMTTAQPSTGWKMQDELLQL